MAAPLAAKEHRVAVGEREVSVLWLRPHGAVAALALAHGAGAGMRHPFMESLAQALAAEGIASLRYQFPYMEAGRRYPDRPPLATTTVRAAVAHTKKLARGLPLLAGGKSFGARMTSQAAANGGLQSVRGLAFFGFPLHAPGKPGTQRADHLKQVAQPMLFLQGTRDAFAGLDLLEPMCRELGARATLHLVDGADHGFAVLKRSGRTGEEVVRELTQATRQWCESLAAG